MRLEVRKAGGGRSAAAWQAGVFKEGLGGVCRAKQASEKEQSRVQWGFIVSQCLHVFTLQVKCRLAKSSPEEMAICRIPEAWGVQHHCGVLKNDISCDLDFALHSLLKERSMSWNMSTTACAYTDLGDSDIRQFGLVRPPFYTWFIINLRYHNSRCLDPNTSTHIQE